MITEIKVPSLGTALKSVKINKILKQEGDEVKKGEPIAEVESNKASFEIYAPCDGTITQINVEINQEAKVDEVIGKIEDSDGKSALATTGTEKESKKINEEPKLDSSITSTKKQDNKKRKKRIFPAARKLIEKYNLDPHQIEGTGIRGAITKKDVMHGLEQQAAESKSLEQPAKEDLAQLEEEIEFSGIRRTIADHMVSSLQSSAQVTTLYEIDMTECKKLKEKISQETDQKLSLMALMIKAFYLGIKSYPKINSSLIEDKIKIKHYVNMGIAVDTDAGLLVPVIFNVERKDLLTINKDFFALVEKARKGDLTPQQMEGGTLTISNAGVMGAIASTPILHYPQSVLLWMGKIQKQPVVRNEEIAIREMMNLCITYDHRVLDGGEISRYAQFVKGKLENPTSLLVS